MKTTFQESGIRQPGGADIDGPDPDYATLAKMATDRAVSGLLSAGIPVVYLKDGRLRRHFPDGSEEDVSETEIREVSGGALP